MRLSKFAVLSLILTGLLAGSSGRAQRRPGDVVTYRNFDFVNAVTASMTNVYFATTGGVIRYDKMRRTWDLPLTGAEGIPQEDINRIWVDRFDQTLVVGTDLGWYEYDDFLDRWSPINELPKLDSDNRHLRAPDVLLPEFDGNYMGQGEFIDVYGRGFTTTDIVDDGTGTLWMGTWGFGPAEADRSSGLMDLLDYGLLQDRVDAIMLDDSLVWVGGVRSNDFRTGLTALQPESNRFIRLETGLYTGLPAVDTYCLESDSARIFVGTPTGLYTVERESGRAGGPLNFRKGLPDDIVLSLRRFDRKLFIGTSGGLGLLDLDTDSIFQVRNETFRRDVVYDIERVDNTLWIGSSAGAFRYTIDTDRLQRFQDTDMVLFGAVLDVEFHGGAVWFSSAAGVVRLDLKTGKSKSYDEPTGLRDRRALAVNDWIIALAADHGLTLIVRDDIKPRTLRVTTADGLASDNVLALQLDGDYLWIGTDRGLTRFLWNNSYWLD